VQAQLLRVNYYNEFDPFAAAWLKELITDGLIPDGHVDDRSICDVDPKDLNGYAQCHFFAGIGGWAYAARLAGWAESRPMWTGSPPCQPFSVAGQKKGTDDERHLWPVWFDLVRQCRPPIIFAEQVSAAIRHGWLDQLQEDLEAENYACAAAVLPASGIGALHKRDRLWIVAHSNNSRSQGRISGWQDTQWQMERGHSGCGSAASSLADSSAERLQRGPEARRERSKFECEDGSQIRSVARSDASTSSVADSNNLRHERGQATGWEAQWRSEYASKPMQCKDGKVRLIPTEPEIFPLAHGIPNRVGTLRGAGNAIVPQAAAEIIRVFV